jgi:hypothetical protein
MFGLISSAPEEGCAISIADLSVSVCVAARQFIFLGQGQGILTLDPF